MARVILRSSIAKNKLKTLRKTPTCQMMRPKTGKTRTRTRRTAGTTIPSRLPLIRPPSRTRPRLRHRHNARRRPNPRWLAASWSRSPTTKTTTTIALSPAGRRLPRATREMLRLRMAHLRHPQTPVCPIRPAWPASTPVRFSKPASKRTRAETWMRG